MKKSSKRLSLTASKVRELNEEAVRTVNGGAGAPCQLSGSCGTSVGPWTYCTCPGYPY